MTGFIVSVFPFRSRVSSKEAFEGLELGEGKPSRPVLRGPGGRKAAWLLGSYQLVRRVSTDKQAIAVFLDQNSISCGSNVRCHAGRRDQNRCYDAFGNQRNVPARIALPAAAKTTAVSLKAARSRRRKVSQSLRSLNLI